MRKPIIRGVPCSFIVTTTVFIALFFADLTIAYSGLYSDLKEINPNAESAVNDYRYPSTTTILETPTIKKEDHLPLISQRATHEQPISINTPIIPNITRRLRSDQPPKIAIIIDDIGYNYEQGLAAIALPGDITYAIIPHSPKANFFAIEATKRNKEIMLHAPMSSVDNMPLGNHGLTESMNETQFKQTLQASLDSLPNISGVNNHMGSLLTQKALPMEWVMQSLQQRQLYFIDSRTSSDSIAWEIAQQFNIPSLKRDVFLDHQANIDFIHQQFSQLKEIAKRQGYAIAIAHPYKETIQYLQTYLHTLAQENIQLVPASTLVHQHSPSTMSSEIAKSVTAVTE